MKDVMYELMQKVLDVTNLETNIEDNLKEIEKKAQEFNDTLNIKNEKMMFTAVDDKGNIIAPVVLAGLPKSVKHDIIYMGLNPLYSDDTYLEKKVAGESWDNYFTSYVDETIYKYLFKDGTNRYYQKVMKILYGLFNDSKYTNINMALIRNDKNFKGMDDGKIFFNLLEDKSFVFPELIPFHSKGFDLTYSKINELRKKIPSYNDYYTSVIDYIKTHIKDDGLIIGNGSPTAAVLQVVFANEGGITKYEDEAISIVKLDNKYALLVKKQFFSGNVHTSKGENVASIVSKIKEVRANPHQKSFSQIKYLLKSDISVSEIETKEERSIKDKQSKKFEIKEEVIIKNKDTDKMKLSEGKNMELNLNDITNSVIEDVLNVYPGIPYTGKKYFYPEAFAKYTEDGLSDKVRKVCYEKYTKNDEITIILVVFDPTTQLGREVIQKAKNSNFPFENLDLETKNSSKRIYKEIIYKLDRTKSKETIYSDAKAAFTGFLDKNNDKIVDALK